ncbi:MAG: thioesterase [Oscillospiraceae bacterium]|nr:thioesterase [Oscillospiraceae bacterium]
MIYTGKAKALYHDCDVQNRLKISAAMRYMQQVSSEQMEVWGIPAEKLLRENMVFVLSRSCIKINRMPDVSERLLLGTAPTAVKGARFVREFAIDSERGERLISAVTLWILIDPESRRILRPASFPYEMRLASSFVGGHVEDVAMPKLPVPEGQRELREVDIRYSHLDCNHHVNNSVYADFICDMLPYEELIDRGIDTLAISFQNEVRMGGKLLIERSAISAGEYYLNGKCGDTACFEALVKLKSNNA